MHYAIETEHQTDRENMLMQKILKSYNGERMKVHTLNQKKHKWACKHTPLLLDRGLLTITITITITIFLFFFLYFFPPFISGPLSINA
jgi:hypothetical protein